jgi:LacI family repressor for deo operon, udp, cdd, tsx, nupC, and nupG
MAEYTNVLEEHHVDGLLFLDFIMDGYDQYMQIWQNNRAMIFRMLDRILTSVPFDGVVTDHYSSSKKLITHILSQGWNDIVLVSESIPPAKRVLGSWRAWKEHSSSSALDLEKNEVAYEVRTAASKYKAVKAFIEAGRVQKGKTALLLDGADGVTGVYGAITESGLTIGKDIAVAATNNTPLNEYVYPELTVIAEPRAEIAKSLVEMLLKKIEGEQLDPIPLDKYEPQLKIGASTCNINH